MAHQHAWKTLSELAFLASYRLWGGTFGLHSSRCSIAVTELEHRKDSVLSVAVRIWTMSHWVLEVISELVHFIISKQNHTGKNHTANPCFPSVKGNIHVILTYTICESKMR